MNSILSREAVLCNVTASDKNEIIRLLSEAFAKTGKVSDAAVFMQDVLKREKIEPTYVGFSLGLPHGKAASVKETGVAIARLQKPVIWNENTGDEAEVIIMLAVPESEAGNTHLDLLAALSRRLIHESFRKQLFNGNAEEIFTLINTVLEEN